MVISKKNYNFHHFPGGGGGGGGIPPSESAHVGGDCNLATSIARAVSIRREINVPFSCL